MKKIRFFLSENFMFLEVKISIYLNRRVFVMTCTYAVFTQHVFHTKQILIFFLSVN